MRVHELDFSTFTKAIRVRVIGVFRVRVWGLGLEGIFVFYSKSENRDRAVEG